MYKYPILKNFEVTSDFYLNLIELKRRYSFILYEKLFNKKIVIVLKHDSSKFYTNFFNKKNKIFYKKKKNEFIIIYKKKFVKLKNSVFDNKIRIFTQKNFSKSELINLFDNLILIKLIQSKFIPVHSSGFYVDNKGYLISSYGGAGKTRLILEASKRFTKLKFFDEWCILKENFVRPLRKDMLLLHYDILAFKDLFSKIDYIRAYISKIFKSKIITELLRIFRLGLPYKYIHFKKIGAFRLKHIFFMSQKNKKKVSISKISKKKILNLIMRNFFYEKRMLHKLISVNNSVAEFENKISIKKLYQCLLSKYVKKIFLRSIFIQNQEKDIQLIFKEIIK